jgi:3-methyl-2-oxobutanoate hydroxymethyltransferase
MSKVTLTSLRSMKQDGKKIAVLTAYDAMFARTLEAAGVDILLVGDSLGMVLQGHESTLPVSVDDMIYHTATVRQGADSALIMTDMPFMSYNSPSQALENAGRIMKEGGAHIVKLEGGGHFLETVKALSRHSIPVCAHLGLQPQSVNKLGGYRVQGRDKKAAQVILDDAMAMQDAGADMMLLECVPSLLAAEITVNLEIPVIGIGAGPSCDGQVLVLHDMLGMGDGKRPKFVKDFLQGRGSIHAAVEAYVEAVRQGEFPDDLHSFD